MSAVNILEKAAGHLKDRADTYDRPDGERSIGATVRAFNAITGDGMMNSEERGWLFMAILKMVRSQQGNYKADNYEDLAAYSGLMGESACEERNGGWTPEAIKAAALKKSCDSAEVEWPDESRIDAIGQNGNDGAVYSEYTLEEVIGDAVLSDWARWVAVDKDGEVWEYSHDVESAFNEWRNHEGWCKNIKKVVPPLNFRNCIWEVNVKPDCEYTLEQVIGDAELSDWARWVAVDKDGEVYEYPSRPDLSSHLGLWAAPEAYDWNWIKDIDPPADFTKCIWEVNVKPDCEYTLEQVIGDAVLSDFAQWVAVDEGGGVREYEYHPYRIPDGWIASGGKYSVLGRVVPPLNFTKCIWEIKK